MDGYLIGAMTINTSIIPGLGFCLPGSVFRFRVTPTLARLRMSVRAFAQIREKKRYTWHRNLSRNTKITFCTQNK